MNRTKAERSPRLACVDCCLWHDRLVIAEAEAKGYADALEAAEAERDAMKRDRDWAAGKATQYADALEAAEAERDAALKKIVAYRREDPGICPQCGPINWCDDDGCCVSCGVSITHDGDGNVLPTAPNAYQRGRAEAAESERDAIKTELQRLRERAEKAEARVEEMDALWRNELRLRQMAEARVAKMEKTSPPHQAGVYHYESNTNCNICSYPLTYSTDSDGYSWQSCSRCGYQSIPAKRQDRADQPKGEDLRARVGDQDLD